jgi:hypothetical protein
VSLLGLGLIEVHDLTTGRVLMSILHEKNEYFIPTVFGLIFCAMGLASSLSIVAHETATILVYRSRTGKRRVHCITTVSSILSVGHVLMSILYPYNEYFLPI